MSAIAKTGSIEFTPEQVDLIRRTICVGGSNDEMNLFLYQCRRTGLDPFAKQIYSIKRQGKMVTQVGIDGFRLIADRTGLYAGNDDPVFDNEDNPTKATVTVYKIVNGIRCAFTATARWKQYYPGDAQGFMWKKMPHLMLGKCAESLALRKAFPAELSGLYTNEEMEQAGVEDVTPEPAKPAAKPVEVKQLPPAEQSKSPFDGHVKAIKGTRTIDQLKVVMDAVNADAKAGRLNPDQIAMLTKLKDEQKLAIANLAELAKQAAETKPAAEDDGINEPPPDFSEKGDALFANDKPAGVPH